MKNLFLMLLPLFLLACNDNSAERAKQEAARIDSIARVKADSIARVKSDSIASARIEEAKKEKEAQRNKFVGTYKLDFHTKDGSLWNEPLFVVLSDGRCVQVSETIGGSKVVEFMGNVVPVSDDAFGLEGSDVGIMAEVNNWNGNRIVGTIKPRHAYSFVFDLSEGKLYFHVNDWRNRDIATVDHTKFTKNSSTSY